MAAVLLRMAGLDPFDADAQAQPPHRELAQIKQGVSGSEGHTVIAADVGGQTTLLKKPLKHSESILFSGRRKGFTGEQKAAGMVGDRQRITRMRPSGAQRPSPRPFFPTSIAPLIRMKHNLLRPGTSHSF